MLRVFISHSAKGPAAEFLAALASGLREDGHQVLLDRDGLEPGVEWRSRLNVWMGGCDAAVVVLSEDALASRYVAYEVSILTYRMNMGSGFTLLPIMLRPVTQAAVKASLVGVTEILERQPAIEAVGGGGSAITQVRQVLRQVKPAETPLDKTAQQLSALLARVPDVDKRAHLASLGVVVPPWIPGDDLDASSP